MPQVDSNADSIEPSTTVDSVSEDPSQEVPLPEGALDACSYIEEPETPDQSPLLHSRFVEWAEAGNGFCYVHSRGLEPRKLMARLSEDRLWGVVWVHMRLERLSEDLAVHRPRASASISSGSPKRTTFSQPTP